jgi:uncharacterized protein (DUF2235 family)
MSKNIIICSDGTGNTSIKGRGTNVFKLFEAVDVNGHRTDVMLTPQVAFYDDGVGTSDWKLLKILGGAFGIGLSRNVRQLYKELVRVYDGGAEPDQIYVFGFSRGAFTVRTLAGFINNQGILARQANDTPEALDHRIKEAYKAYRRCYRPALWRMWPWRRLFPAVPRPTSEGKPRIRFIGVWDTVDAVGLPFHVADIWNKLVYQFKFENRDLGQNVEQACHALAIDDERAAFSPVLWNQPASETRIEQVWFPGSHSNVGGGYPKQGMSLVSLDWMMEKASHAGLRFLQSDRQFCRDHLNGDDKLYDPRAGVGVFYRWKPRDITELSRKAQIERPVVHISALERVAHGTEDYVPGNIPDTLDIFPTPQATPMANAVMSARAAALNMVIAAAPPNMLPKVRGIVLAGWLSYYLYLVTGTAALLLVISGGEIARVWNEPFDVVGNAIGMVWSLIRVDMVAVRTVAYGPGDHPVAWSSLAALFVLSIFISLYTGRRMKAHFGLFWQGQQQELREALKDVRVAVAAMMPQESSAATPDTAPPTTPPSTAPPARPITDKQ